MSLSNSIQNSALADLARKASNGVVSAIQTASQKTGVDFAYLLQQAQAESSFRTDLTAKTSSASGLFQFIESTWMGMVEKYGDKHGISTEGKSREEILAMRFDEEKASVMAAEFASENERVLEKKWGGDIGATELYFAHFLGAGQASEFLKARDENPLQEAATLFPRAAKANYNVFYDRHTGRARTMDEVYGFFDKKFKIESTPNHAPKTHQPSTIMLAQRASEAKTTPSYNSLYTNTRNVPSSLNNDGSYWGRSYSPAPYQALINSPVDVMLLAELEMPLMGKDSDKSKLF